MGTCIGLRMLPPAVRIADLPWYDLGELQAETDAWWCGIARHLRRLGVEAVPDALTRDGSHVARWEDPALLLSQACGYDVLYDHAGVIVPFATPCYTADGCVGPRYRSFVVVREDLPCSSLAALRGRRAVVNEAASHSGTNALRALVAPLAAGGAFFASVEQTGSHRDSLLALQANEADVACVDVVVLDLLRAVKPEALHGLRVLAVSAPALAPPYVTSVHTPAALRRTLCAALRAAVQDPELAPCRRALLLADFVFLPASAYAELAAFEEPALRAGYHEPPAPRRSPLHRSAGAMRAGVERGPCAARRAAR